MTKKGKHWKQWEDDILTLHCHSSMDSLLSMLPGRSVAAIKNRARRLGLQVGALSLSEAKEKWSESEIRILKTHAGAALDELCRLLPGRTRSAIEIRCRLCEIPYRKEARSRLWSQKENAILEANEGADISLLCALLPNRTPAAIKAQCRKLHLHFSDKSRSKELHFWSEKEDRIVADHLNENISVLCALLPEWTKSTIIHKRCVLKRKQGLPATRSPWTEDELSILKENLDVPLCELCTLFPGRTQNAVRFQVRLLKTNR